MRTLGFCLLTLLCTACGFHWGRGALADDLNTVSIPYVDGDLDGILTAEVTKRMAEWGGLDYRHRHGDLTLQLTLKKTNKRAIGYRFDRSGKGRIKERLVPVEERLLGRLEILLINNRTGETLLGPTEIEASADLDHDYYTIMSGAHTFSLGQLADSDLAREMAMRVLYENLADQVVDFLAAAL